MIGKLSFQGPRAKHLAFFARASLLIRAASTQFPAPDEVVHFKLRESWDAGKNSKLLRFELPPTLPTLSRPAPSGVSVLFQGEGEPEVLKKSYSPVSPPDAEGYFDLLVKAYPPRPGGGVGAFLCGLEPGDRAAMKVKDPRRIHGSEVVAGRWDHLGFVAGGTGIAPFVQIISALLANKTDTTSLSLLSVNRRHEDILMKAEIDDLSKQSNGRFRVTYALTQPTSDDQERVDFVRGRGDASLALKALPPPLESTRTPPNEEVGVSASAEVEDHRSSPLGGAQEGGTMVMVCGTDGFVDSWAGAITRTKNPATGKKAKLQGPLMGWLRDAGFREQEVYKF